MLDRVAGDAPRPLFRFPPPLPHDAAFHRQTFYHRVGLITRADLELCLNFTSKLKFMNTDTSRLVPASKLASASSLILQLIWPHLRPLLEKKEHSWTTFFVLLFQEDVCWT